MSYLSETPSLFRPIKRRSNWFRVWLWIGLLLGAIWFLLQVNRGQVKPLFQPTLTPTRAAQSYILEAQALFNAGKLDDPNSDQDAIGAYQMAVLVEPTNAAVWAELARIQNYSSSTLSTDTERLARRQEALVSAQKAAELAPDDSTIQAILAFVLDWNASSNLITVEQREDYLTEAERVASRAYNLDPNNVLALAFYAEVLLDQQRWAQALQYAEQAVALGDQLMDTHRVYATVLEYQGNYRVSIEEYQKAVAITPNLTFLHLLIGFGYRNLGNRAAEQGNPDLATTLYEDALEYFDRAVSINEQIGVRDPQPYIAIAKTYVQLGEFFVAARNAEKALKFDPLNADAYAQLGDIYVRAKNYEYALPALECAVEGCQAIWLTDRNDPNSLNAVYCKEVGGCGEREIETAEFLFGADILEKSVQVQPLNLTNLTVAYHYIRYGSVLGYLNRAGSGYCDKAIALMQTLRDSPFGSDVFLLQNIEANESLCAGQAR